MVGTVARDDLVLARVHAGDLEGSLIRFSPAGGEEELLEPCGQHFEKLGTEPGAGFRRIYRADEGQIARLPGDRLDDGRILVAEVYAHELCAEIEVALARAVSDPAAFGIGDVEWLPRLLEAPCAVVGLAGKAADLFCG